jgi:hypothetical protein
MKIVPLLFTLIGLGAITVGLSYANEPASQPSKRETHEYHAASDRSSGPEHGQKIQSNGKHSEPKEIGRAAEKGIHAGALNMQGQQTQLNELHQAALGKAAPAAKNGLIMNKLGNHNEQTAKLPPGKEFTVPTPVVVLGRSANTVSTGGLARSSIKNSSSLLDGGAIKRKL